MPRGEAEGAWLPPQLRKEEVKKDDGALEEPRAAQAEAPCVVPLTLQNLNKLQKEQEAKKAQEAKMAEEAKKAEKLYPYTFTAYDCQGVRLVTQGDAEADASVPRARDAEREITTQGSGADVGNKRKGRYAEQTITPWTKQEQGTGADVGNMRETTTTCRLHKANFLLVTYSKSLLGPEAFLGSDGRVLHGEKYMGEDECMIKLPFDLVPMNLLPRKVVFESDGVELVRGISEEHQKMLHVDRGPPSDVARLEFVKAFLVQKARNAQLSKVNQHDLQLQQDWLLRVSPEDIGLVEIRSPGDAHARTRKRGYFPEGTAQPLSFRNDVRSKGVWDPKKKKLQVRGINRPTRDIHNDFSTFFKTPNKIGKPIEDLTFGDVGVRVQESGKEGVGKMIVLGGKERLKMSGKLLKNRPLEEVQVLKPIPAVANKLLMRMLQPQWMLMLRLKEFLLAQLQSLLLAQLHATPRGWPLGFVARRSGEAREGRTEAGDGSRSDEMFTGDFTTALAEVEQAIAMGAETSGGGESDHSLLAFFEENMTAASAWIWSSARVYHGALPLNLSEPRYSAESRYAVYDKSKWRHYSKKQLQDALEKVEQKYAEMQAKKTSGRKIFNSKLLAEVEREKNMLRERVYGGDGSCEPEADGGAGVEKKRLENVLLYWQWVQVGSDLFAVMEKWLSR
eukprot:g8389.t1